MITLHFIPNSNSAVNYLGHINYNFRAEEISLHSRSSDDQKKRAWLKKTTEKTRFLKQLKNFCFSGICRTKRSISLEFRSCCPFKCKVGKRNAGNNATACHVLIHNMIDLRSRWIIFRGWSEASDKKGWGVKTIARDKTSFYYFVQPNNFIFMTLMKMLIFYDDY